MAYAFGTTRQAAARLESIATVFNPLADPFVRAHPPRSATTAIDLGCGPGFTTDLLARAAGCTHVYGLDSSTEMLAMAAKRFPRAIFLRHDVTRVPFPVRADVMYARFLLSHLPEPVDLVGRWAAQLEPGGVLLVEEVEAVETRLDAFRDYLATSEALVASGGTSLFVGRELAGGDYNAHVLVNECVTLPVANRVAATWFLPNTQTVWRDSPVVRERLSGPQVEAIWRELARLADTRDPQSDITWKMRRLALRRP